jgi:hypothetical protein
MNPLFNSQQGTDPQGFCFCFFLHRAASEVPGRGGCKMPSSIPKIVHKMSNHHTHVFPKILPVVEVVKPRCSWSSGSTNHSSCRQYCDHGFFVITLA